MIFDCKEVEVAGKDGTLDAIGVEWTEARTIVEAMFGKLAMAFLYLSFITGVFALISTMAVQKRAWVLPAMASALFLGLACGSVWTGARMAGKRRTFLFHADGRISTSQDGWWKTTTADIRSIEAEQLKQKKKKDDDSDYTHGVRVITRRGRVLHIAKDLEPDDAAGLSVLLNEIWEAVKYPQVVPSIGEEPIAVW